MNSETPPPKSARRLLSGKPAIAIFLIPAAAAIFTVAYQKFDRPKSPAAAASLVSADERMKNPRPPKKSAGQLLGEIVAGLDSATDAGTEAALAELLPQLVALDPLAAARWAESLPPGTLRNDGMRRLAKAWAEIDFAAAADWGAFLDDAGEQLITLSECVSLLSQTDPAAAMAMIEDYDLSAYNQNMENVALLWAERDLPGVSEWASGLPGGDLREQALARIALIQSRTDPAGAADLIVREMASEPSQMEAAVTVIHQWARVDLPAASVWAERFPQGPMRERMKSEIAGQHAQQASGN